MSGFPRRAALALLASPALAQPGWPQRSVRIVVPFPPGGSNDVIARPLADRLQAQLESDAAIVEFIAPAGVALTIDGVARTLSPAEVLTQPATAAVVVDVPGVLSVRINPGATAVTLRANLAAAQTVLRRGRAARSARAALSLIHISEPTRPY